MSISKTPVVPLEAMTTPVGQGATSNRQRPEFVVPTPETLGRLALAIAPSGSRKTLEAARSFASLLNRGSSQE